MARTLPSTIGGVPVVDVTLGAGKTVATFEDAWAWIYDHYPDLTSANVMPRILVTGMITSGSASPSIGGSIVGDATRYVIVTADAGQSICDQPASSTPIRHNSSYAGLIATNSAYRTLPIPSTYSGPLRVEALQLRRQVAGDGVIIASPAGVPLIAKNNLITIDGNNFSGVTAFWALDALTSHNNVVISECDELNYVALYSVDSASAPADVQNDTFLVVDEGANGASNWSGAAPAGSVARNLLLLCGWAGPFGGNWTVSNVATNQGSTTGSGAIVGLTKSTTVESSAKSNIDARLRSTATSVKDGGYDNTSVVPVDFFYRVRASSGPNIGAFDPDATDPEPPAGNALLLQLMQQGQFNGGLL